jgi:hypothetical protein
MFRRFIGTLVIGLAVAAIGPTLHAADDANKCTIALKGENIVVKACTQGGIKRAKATMKAMTKAAKEKGMKVECDSCHKNETDWAVTDDGDAQFKKMLELLK